jgi:serine protease Do
MKVESRIEVGRMHRRGAVAVAATLLVLFLSASGWAQKLDAARLRNGSAVRKAFRQVVADARQSTVRVIEVQQSGDEKDDKDLALGVVVDSAGFVLTKASELNGSLECRLQDGRKLSARIVGLHRDYDLAMLKIDATKLPAVKWASGDDAAVGAWLATPGMDQDPVSVGVVSVARRKIPRQRAMLGIELVADETLPKIKQVFPNSGAARAGLKANDVITRVAGQKVKTREALIRALRAFRPGDTLNLLIRRGNEEKSLSATLGDSVSSRPNRANLQNQLGGRLSRRRAGFDAILQHDTVLRPRDCGGVIVGLDGRAVGINIARAGRIESYAIPAAIVVSLLDDLKSGKLAPPNSVVKTEDDEPAPPALPEDASK